MLSIKAVKFTSLWKGKKWSFYRVFQHDDLACGLQHLNDQIVSSDRGGDCPRSPCGLFCSPCSKVFHITSWFEGHRSLLLRNGADKYETVSREAAIRELARACYWLEVSAEAPAYNPYVNYKTRCGDLITMVSRSINSSFIPLDRLEWENAERLYQFNVQIDRPETSPRTGDVVHRRVKLLFRSFIFEGGSEADRNAAVVMCRDVAARAQAFYNLDLDANCKGLQTEYGNSQNPTT